MTRLSFNPITKIGFDLWESYPRVSRRPEFVKVRARAENIGFLFWPGRKIESGLLEIPILPDILPRNRLQEKLFPNRQQRSRRKISSGPWQANTKRTTDSACLTRAKLGRSSQATLANVQQNNNDDRDQMAFDNWKPAELALMTIKYKTAQESFWAGEFGESYQERNAGELWIAANTAFFAKILGSCDPIGSVIEIGPNVGLNLMALRRLLPEAELTGVEINASAIDKLRANVPEVNPVHSSVLDWLPESKSDLVFTKGVLIHIDPDELNAVYEKLFACSKRFILIAEYYNPVPQMIPYRGHENRLFKRDFAGELLDKFTELRIRDYGFVWHRDPHFPQDDLTWFLLEKAERNE